MDFKELNLNEWLILSENAQLQMARIIPLQLPRGFSFAGLYESEMDGNISRIAQFKYKDRLFSFIPGAQVTLGWVPNPSYNPSKEQLDDWAASVVDFGIEEHDLVRYIEQNTTPIRTVVIKPFLMETKPQQMNAIEIKPGDPQYRELARQSPGRGLAKNINAPNGRFEIAETIDGIIKIKKIVREKTTAEVAELFREEGFRLPTNDQWEYACGAGARTLFRWGNHPDETLEKAPNVFGLHIANDPYICETVQEEDFIRGGDGGATFSAGAGFMAEAIPHATAFFISSSQYGMLPSHARRVLNLD